MDLLKSFFIFQILLLSISVFSQNKQLEKANKRYQIKKYAEAIPLYEEGLAKNPSISAKARLAYCYRINNNIDKSVALYAEVVQAKKPRAITLYYYGEALMSQGKYEEATIWLKKYTDKKPEDAKGWRLLESIKKIQEIQPYFKVANVEEFAHNSDSDDSAPAFYHDGIIFTSDRKTGMKMMKKKSGWTGRDFLSVYQCSKKEDGTFTSPHRLPKRINNLNKNTGTFTLSPDGTYIIFSRNNDVSNRKDLYNLVLYRADVSEGGKFKNVKKLSFCGKTANYMHPAFSPDGQTLFYTSDKKGEGGTDIFYSTLSKKGWSRPKNIGTPINTSANEGFPFVDQEGRLFFCSKGHPSFGGFDIFFSQKNENEKWSAPINLGNPINSPADDISIFISKNYKKGLFASSRKGGDDDIYFFDIEGINDPNSMNFANQTPEETPVETPAKMPEDTPTASSTNQEEHEEYLVNSTQNQSINTTAEKATTTTQNTLPTETKTELPFATTEPFEEKKTEKKTEKMSPPTEPQNIEVKIENASSTAVAIPAKTSNTTTTPTSSNSFEIEIETISTPTDTAKVENIEKENFDIPMKEEPAKFQEGLANLDTPMTEETPILKNTEKSNKVIEEDALAEMKEYLSYQSPQEGTTFILDKIKFDAQKYLLTPPMATRLDTLVRLLNEFPDVKIEVSSHTQSIGDDRKNMITSIKRATAVAGYLIRHGIATDRIKVMGYGETQLLNRCSNGVNCSPEEHLVNQRIEIKIRN